MQNNFESFKPEEQQPEPEINLLNYPLPRGLDGVFDGKPAVEIFKRHGLSQKQAEGVWADYVAFRTNEYETAIRQQEFEQRLQREEAVEEKLIDSGEQVILTPEEAGVMLSKIIDDKNSAYWSDTAARLDEHERQVCLVNRLREIQAGITNRLDGYAANLAAEKKQRMEDIYENVDLYGKNRSSSSGERRPDYPDDDDLADGTEDD